MILKVINLDRALERMSRFIEWRDRLTVERWVAVDGAAHDRDEFIEAGIITPDNAYSPGALGCAMSHVNLWQLCAAGDEPFHIAEDDTVLRHDFKEAAEAALAQLSDWDIVLWTHNVDWPVLINPGGVGITLLYQHTVAPDLAFQSATVAPKVMPLVAAAGTGCYSVSPAGARRMLADCLPIANETAPYFSGAPNDWGNSGIDVELSRHYARWRAYVAIPVIAINGNDQSQSTIRGHMAQIFDPASANRAIV